MEMTENEIKRSYSESKHKKRQIGILADLNCCSKEKIERILEENEKREPIGQGKNEITVPYVKNVLFLRLDELDSLIKKLEKEYREIVVALKVIEGVETVILKNWETE